MARNVRKRLETLWKKGELLEWLGPWCGHGNSRFETKHGITSLKMFECRSGQIIILHRFHFRACFNHGNINSASTTTVCGVHNFCHCFIDVTFKVKKVTIMSG